MKLGLLASFFIVIRMDMKKILLTGATGGLGRCLAKKLAAGENGQLICIYRNQKKYEEILGDACRSMQGCLVTGKQQDYAALIEILDEGKADEIVLILNAFSISPIKSIGDYEADEIAEMISGNLTGNVTLINTVVNYCKKRNVLLRVINLDSGAADFPLKGWANYCAAKAYMNSFLAVLALENPEYKIVSFDPGVMDTGMQEIIRNTEKEVFNLVDTFIGYKNSGQLRKPEDVADQMIERYICDWTADEMREKIR